MDEKKYKEAVDEIKASEELKNKTLEKMQTKKSSKVYLKVISVAAVVMLVFSVSFFGMNEFKKNDGGDKPEEKKNVAIVDSNEYASHFKDKNELREYLEKQAKSSYRGEILVDYAETDSISMSATNGESKGAVMSQNVKSETGTDSDSSNYSKTNNQVEGVEEADIIKTDGRYIYYICRSGDSRILIIDAQNLEILEEIDDLEERHETVSPEELFIFEDKMIVIADKWKDVDYDYDYYLDTDSTCAFIFDISDKEDVELERTIEIDGNYISSRMIDDDLYFITEKYVYFYDDIKDREIIPYFTDTAVSRKEQELSLDCICCLPDSDERTYVNIVGVDVDDDDDANIQTIIGASAEVYSSEKYIYISKPNYRYNRYIGSESSSTEIFKIKLDNSKVSFVAKGKVRGTILNQFSMDEYKGNLRIATTSYNRKYDTENNIYILDKDLNEIGYLEGLAKEEQIYSVRFMGKTGYVVTFKQVDPLFVIDLSDPKNPEVKGKLKIPGYSSYLHPYDDTHVIGIGKNTEETQYGATVNTNMKMSMFDVSDLENPKEMFSVSIGGKGTYSEILNNHKALFFNKEKNLIGFPITIYDENDTDYYSKTRMQGAIIYEIDLENKEFKEKGTISLKKVETGYYSYDYSRVINRIIYIGDKIYALSDSIMKVVDIYSLKELGELEF
ncbi:MAG: beta-propeller domain-containing protein [Clostridia bacterium]|nr:beta-propeller domain-containing protein [Clostridia bacterium]